MKYSAILGALLFLLVSCGSVELIAVNAESIPMDSTLQTAPFIDSIVEPYKSSLDAEMNEVIAVAVDDFIAERPSGTLNNWSADAVLQAQLDVRSFDAPVFCLLNQGGLRTSINKGNVTIGDIFKVMPFDNEVVYVKMPVEALEVISAYLKERGGEPIAGAKIVNGKFELKGLDESSTHVWIITSDYLMNGGDNMSFFEMSLERIYSGLLLRDVMINEAEEQKQLVPLRENRMQF